MKENNVTTIDIEFDAEVFTSESASNLLISTFEYLLYQRHQIPFVFQTFQYMTSKWSHLGDDSGSYEVHSNFYLEKQRNLALSTLRNIVELSNNVSQEFQQNSIRTARILFGSTPVTPKEIYVIKLPQISLDHSPENHKKSLNPMTNKVIMSLLTSQKLFKAFSDNLRVTNMYLDIETQGTLQGENENFQIKEEPAVTTRCPTIVINLIRKECSSPTNCCRNIRIFQSENGLNMGDNEVIPEVNLTTMDDAVVESCNTWKEAKIFVRGFKDVCVKGRSIWED